MGGTSKSFESSAALIADESSAADIAAGATNIRGARSLVF
jgi:hypothetical protein